MSETATVTAPVIDLEKIQETKNTYVYAHAEVRGAHSRLTELREPLDKQILALETEFKEKNADLYNSIEHWESTLDQANMALREAALAHYTSTGEKTLDENLSVRVAVKYVYEQDKAVEWAEKNAPIMIVKSVDKKAFESLPKVDDLEFVYKTETPTSVIKGL